MEQTYFIPGLTFERLAADDAAMKAFQQLLISIKSADWNVTKAEETVDNSIPGILLTMKPMVAPS